MYSHGLLCSLNQLYFTQRGVIAGSHKRFFKNKEKKINNDIVKTNEEPPFLAFIYFF